MVLRVKNEIPDRFRFRLDTAAKRETVATPSKINVISKKDIGQKVRAIRNARGMNQARLAKILGTHQTGISQIEVGRRGLTLQQLVKLAKALRVSVDEILGQAQSQTEEGLVRDRHLVRRMQLIAKLPSPERKALLKTIDAFLKSSNVA